MAQAGTVQRHYAPRQHHTSPLPPYAPELNPIENVWAYLRANKLAISIFDSYDHIVEKCCDAWNFFAEDKETVQNITSREYAKSVIL